MKWDAARHTTGGNWGAGPSLAERVDAEVSVGGKPVKVYALGQNGERGAAVPTETRDGRTVIKLGAAKTLWFEVLLPRWAPHAVADPCDVLAYAAGALIFQRWLNK